MSSKPGLQTLSFPPRPAEAEAPVVVLGGSERALMTPQRGSSAPLGLGTIALQGTANALRTVDGTPGKTPQAAGVPLSTASLLGIKESLHVFPEILATKPSVLLQPAHVFSFCKVQDAGTKYQRFPFWVCGVGLCD